MAKIPLNNEVKVDLPTLIDSRLLIQANSGGGKSWILRRLLEQSHGKVQHIVIDLEGEFSTLREKFDYVVAGKGGDTPADPRSAAILARKLLELKVSAIIDLYELNHMDRKRFVKLFLDAMINAPKELWTPVLLVIDEAHQFCPEKGQAESADAVIDMATRGRKRGFSVVLATQRLSKLHKDAAAECNNKLIGRTGLDIDMKRAAEELGFSSKEQYLSLRSLEPGEFFGYGPAISREVMSFKVGEVQTTHPKAGGRIASSVVPPTDRIKKILGGLGDLPAEAKKEAQTLEEMRSEIRTLKAHKCPATSVDPKAIEKAVNAAVLERERAYDKERQEMIRQTRNFLKIIEQIAKIITPLLEKGIELPTPPTFAPVKMAVDMAKSGSVDRTVVSRVSEGEIEVVGDGEVKGGALTILKVLGERFPMHFTKSQLGSLSGYRHTSGSFKTFISQLRSRGLIDTSNGKFSATDEGVAYLGITPTPPQDLAEYRAMWYSILQGGAKKIFRILEDAGRPMSKEEISAESGYSATSGSFKTFLSQLRSNGLIEADGSEVKLTDKF